MKKKYYAVKKGLTTGVFESWPECQECITGYSGAEFKGFSTQQEAEDYLYGKSTTTLPVNTETELLAYVDGSFDIQVQRYAFGAIIITPKSEIIKESGYAEDANGVAIRNVAGELLGAIYVCRWAINNAYTSIKLYYDYEGIEKWASGEWKAKNIITKRYIEEMQKIKPVLSINFNKVAAHTNNTYNEMADQLAKEALKTGKKAKISKGDFWYKAEGITIEDIKLIVEIICGDNKAIETNEIDIPHGKQISLYIPKKEKVFINHYSAKNSVLIQGKPKELFSTILSYITELVDIDADEIPAVFNSTFNINIDKDNVLSEFKSYMPNSCDKLSEKMLRVLHQAVYNLNLTGELFEASFLVQPAFRALEGHLKLILAKASILDSTKSLKDVTFDMFVKNGYKYYLKEKYSSKITKELFDYFGKCYTYYNMNRHTFSHWDDPTEEIDTTAVLTVSQAHDMIIRTLSIIDEYYAL